ncbi:hypothetical protein ACQP06_28480 [Nocardia sp. CA-136227]|uniref:hypothetical protein n=1 Tax=Nocardia sp. CA-136227 TaxID=3239979 RepID=UPI003D990B69
MKVPDEVRALLAGRPEAGAWDPIFPLLTVDAAGFPHVCLLGRAELAVDAERVFAVLASATTIANLRRTGRATLLVIGSSTGLYCKMSLAGAPLERDGLIGFEFTTAEVKYDSAGVDLLCARFRVDAGLMASERWQDSAALLAELAGRAADG